MNKIAYTNTTKQMQFFGGVMIPPGDTREIDPTHLPNYRPNVAEAIGDKAVHITDFLLSQSVPEILAALPTLDLEDAAQLGEKEQIGAGRKEILSAVSERLLTEANTKLGPIAPPVDNPNEAEQAKKQAEADEKKRVTDEKKQAADAKKKADADAKKQSDEAAAKVAADKAK